MFLPCALEGRNLLNDPEALMLEGRFARSLVRKTKYHPAIIAWDLGNECNNLGTADNPAQAWNWLNTISSAVRMEDLPGARWYFETDDYGGLEYWLRLSYVARRGARLIQP